MGFCPNCGNKIEPGQNYCSNCGQKPVQDITEKMQSKKPKSRRHVVISVLIVALVIAIAAIASGLVIWLNSDNDSSYYSQPYPTYTYQPQPTYTPTTHALLSNETLFGPSYSYSSYSIQVGKTISLSWSADGYVSVYILTETQYEYFSTWGFHASPAAYDSGSSGSLSYHVANTDTYYLVVNNPSVITGVKVYSATASW